MIYATWDWEEKHRAQGVQTVVGLDEVGRGCWAGPLVAVAYRFYSFPCDVQVGDSKKHSEKQRATLIEILKALGEASIGEVSVEELNDLGLQQAQYLAYERALGGLSVVPEVVLLDGREWKTDQYRLEAIVKGDSKVASIAAASVVAKVYRDTLMQTTYHEQYPLYGFNQHVGYGTKLHQEALKQHGVTPVHRLTYKPIKQLLEQS